MKTVLGALNKTSLQELMLNATPFCTEVEAAVAYASDSTLFDHCYEQKLPLTYYGLLNADEAVNTGILKRFIDRGSPSHRCYLIRDRYHPKVIWWHGYGAYIGSANFSQNAWWQNVEAGLFLTEEEMAKNGTDTDLAVLFDYLAEIAQPLKVEILDALANMKTNERYLQRVARQERFDGLFGFFPPHKGLTSVPAKGERPNRGIRGRRVRRYDTRLLDQELRLCQSAGDYRQRVRRWCVGLWVFVRSLLCLGAGRLRRMRFMQLYVRQTLPIFLFYQCSRYRCGRG